MHTWDILTLLSMFTHWKRNAVGGIWGGREQEQSKREHTDYLTRSGPKGTANYYYHYHYYLKATAFAADPTIDKPVKFKHVNFIFANTLHEKL